MRKGILHIVESLIVILLVFVILSQFYSIPRPQHAWSESKLRIMAQDLLYVLEESGVDWYSASDIENKLSGIPPTIGYSVVTKSQIPPVINVSCVCDGAEYVEINNALQDISINNRIRIFNVDQTNPLDFDLDGPHLGEYDVILFYDFPSINAAEEQNLTEYLKQGKGIVEYSALTQAQVNQAWHQGIFGFEWTTSTRPGSADAVFQTAAPPSRIYDIKKLYSVINGATYLNNFGTETVYPTAPNEESRIILKQNNTYTSGPQSGHSIPLAIINWNVYGNGRTAWMSDGPLADNMNSDLLRTLVIWASAEKEHVVRDELMFQSSKATFRKIVDGPPPNPMFEPLLIELTVGYQF